MADPTYADAITAQTQTQIRDGLLASLATTDPDVETTQAPHASMMWAQPSVKVGSTSENLNEILIVVYAYSSVDDSTKIGGTIDLQPLERAPDPVLSSGKIYIGRTPAVALPIGRAHPISARYLHGLSARLSSPGGAAAGANHFRVLYRSNR